MIAHVSLLCFCLLGTASAEEHFERFNSTRYSFNSSSQTPWKRLALGDALVIRAASSEWQTKQGAWVVSNGSAFILSSSGTLTKVQAIRGDPTAGAACSRESFVLLSADSIQWIHSDTHQEEQQTGFSFGKILSTACEFDGTVWVGTSGKLYRIAHNSSDAKLVITGENISAIATAVPPNGTAACNPYVAVGSDLAVRHSFDCKKLVFKRHSLVGGEIDAPATALQFVPRKQQSPGDAAFELWVGHQWCLNVLRADGLVTRVDGRHGLPVSNITSLSYSEGSSGMGGLWIASKVGLALLREPYMNTRTVDDTAPDTVDYTAPEDRWRYFGGDRWLPGSSVVTGVYATASTSTGTATMGAWVQTSTGLAYISSEPTTLRAQAAVLTALVPSLSRYRWVAAAHLKSYGDASADSITLGDGDNDGLWTGMLVASQVMRWIVTGEEEARTLAWHHFAAVEFLHNVTQIPHPTRSDEQSTGGHADTEAVPLGFIARSAVRCGEAHQKGDHQPSCPPGSSVACGWVNSTKCFDGVDKVDGPCCWTYKRDTSTDEVTGHFYTLALVHDLLATNDDERRRVALPICRTAKYIVDGGFVFIDPFTGNRTSWGYWDPAELNGIPGKDGERGENSLEILSYLALAARICDDKTKSLPKPSGRSPRGWPSPPSPSSSASPPFVAPFNGTTFGEAFAFLVREPNNYDLNMVNALLTNPASVATFDFRLSLLGFSLLHHAAPNLTAASHYPTPSPMPPSIPLTPAEASLFRKRYLMGVRRYWGNENDASSDTPRNPMSAYASGASLTASNQQLPAWSALFSHVTHEAGLTDPTWQLRRYPWDMIDWPTKNSVRSDVSFDPYWAAEYQQMIVCQILPADEALSASSSDFVTEAAANAVDSGGGHVLNAPNAWLLAYWMGEYFNSI
jgi:hypothetical protein